jgi:hypothetical protein
MSSGFEVNFAQLLKPIIPLMHLAREHKKEQMLYVD